ncbi:unnamed protein product [Moneuplotes crassus]|uniref:C2 domain-containing protein n=1 Tax=Euplotes crassus TaxID=5936 RepID=A0AAD1X7A9_EUPCR|nr:unnamed protein product [Moneuplotes crassus]
MEPRANMAPHVGEPTERISLHISCKNLKDLDIITASDPICYFYIEDASSPGEWALYGETEQIENNLNPQFVTYFEINYYFERLQRVKFEIFDVDSSRLERIGNFETTIGKIMGSVKNSLTGELTMPGKTKSRGVITICAEKVSSINDIIYFGLDVTNLKSNKGFLCGSDSPFVYIERQRSEDHNEFLRIIQIEPVIGTLNPTWRNLKFEVKEICNGDLKCKLIFKVCSWRNSGHHKFYGSFETCLEEILQGRREFNICDTNNNPINDSKKQMSMCTIEDFKIEERASFYDFLQSEWKINLSVCVDFTKSNGRITKPTSLHFLDPSGKKMNDYQNAIRQVGNILEAYDYNQKYPCYGFGGIPNDSGWKKASHCFNLNGQDQPEADGVNGILEAYQFSLLNCQLFQPTKFGPCLRKTIDYVKEHIEEKMYHVLLILTDGNIHDMKQTKNYIVEASHYPISIIIVGLGENSFDLMVELDGDDVVLKNSRGRATRRDIVQFVKFNDFKGQSSQALAEEVLEEVPEQVVSYLYQNKVNLEVD